MAAKAEQMVAGVVFARCHAGTAGNRARFGLEAQLGRLEMRVVPDDDGTFRFAVLVLPWLRRIVGEGRGYRTKRQAAAAAVAAATRSPLAQEAA